MRWRVVFGLAIAVGAAGIAAAATGGGASTPKNAQTTAQGIDGLVSQVQSSFGDGSILSASMNGSLLSVKVAAADQPSEVHASFEAQMLAYAVRDWLNANGQAPINSVQYLDSSGAELKDEGVDPVGNNASVAPLGNGACNSAAQAAQAEQASLTVGSVLTLPYAGGACAFKFQTPDPSGFAANAPLTINKLVNGMGDPNERAYLVEVDDQAGTPEFVASYIPSAGGQAYIKPGLSTVFDGGGRPIGGPPTQP
ncbi:MAG TPA: hypothetical protein VGK69_06270 [Gaiellaceae bacterium]